MPNKKIILPGKEEMLSRLLTVDSEPHFQERLYPKFLEAAGEQKVAMGVVMLIQLAVYDYLDGMPPIMGVMMDMKIPSFIDALIPDEEVAAEAKEFFDQVSAK